MATKFKKLLKSFTLIELIIVIAIIAVLGATAFLLLTQWMSKGRDAQRISDLNVIQNALNIQITQSDSLPIPDGYNTVTYTGEIILYQGKFGSGVVSKITSLVKLPIDKVNGEYDYSLLSDRLTYKVQAIMENTNYKTTYMQRVFADILSYRYVGKDLRGVIVGNDFLYLPNLFLTGYVNGQYDLGSGMNVFLGNKVGDYVPGGIVDKDNKDGIIAMMTGLGLSINEATSIYSKATGVSIKTSGATQPEDTSWCYYSSNELSNAHTDWNNTELKYDTVNKKCYVFGDEDANSKAACDEWVSDNVTTGGNFVWVPARWFITDGVGTNMKDPFYQREVIYNSKDYICRGFAIAKYEMSYNDTSPKNSSDTYRSTRAYDPIKTSLSMADRLSIVDINQSNAIADCKKIGSNYHLITNNEWMTISRNIEMQSSNWSVGIIGNGYIDNGLDNRLSRTNGKGSIGCYDDDDSYADQTGGGSCVTQRQLILSSQATIRDLAGNVREHVNKANTIDGTNHDSSSTRLSNICQSVGWFSFNNNDGEVACIFQNDYNNNVIGPMNSNINSIHGIGRIRSNIGINNIFLRGGSAYDGTYAGLYSIDLNRNTSNSNGHVGFRCAR
ncbi:MAG: prepilin-type N-terminal cleavage/methylation domain-containing protein [Candidatus Absconditabacteria bacterium]